MTLQSHSWAYIQRKSIWKDTCTSMFIAVLSIIAKTWKPPKCPSTEEWIKKWYIHTVDYYSAIKMNEIVLLAATWMNLESVILSEVSWTAKEKYCIASLICGIQKELIQMNLLIKQKEIHGLRKWTYGWQGEGIVREFGKIMYTLPYSEWITNKDLVHSTWNSAQCNVPTSMGWGFGRMDTCICKAEFLCCSPETTTVLLSDYTPIQNKKFKICKKNII